MHLAAVIAVALAASSANAIMRAINDNSGDGNDRPPVGTLNSRALPADGVPAPPRHFDPNLHARSVPPQTLAPRSPLHWRRPGKPRRHHVLTPQEQQHLEAGLRKVGKPVKKGSKAALTVACLLGFVLPPPADVIVEGGCLAESVAEMGAKGIKKEVDKKEGKAPAAKSGDGAGLMGDLRTLGQGGNKQAEVKAAEDIGKKSGKFLWRWGSRVHIKRSTRGADAALPGSLSTR